MRGRLAVVLLVACARGDTAAKLSVSTRERLVGTWRAVEYTRGPDGSEYPFGRPPVGYLVYDATGHVFFQVGRRGDSLPPRNRSWTEADSSTLQHMLKSASAYFGTYTVDEAHGTVTHHIEGEVPPVRAATEVATPFEIRQDTLAISSWLFVRVR